jgi:hypothetical protein
MMPASNIGGACHLRIQLVREIINKHMLPEQSHILESSVLLQQRSRSAVVVLYAVAHSVQLVAGELQTTTTTRPLADVNLKPH